METECFSRRPQEIKCISSFTERRSHKNVNKLRSFLCSCKNFIKLAMNHCVMCNRNKNSTNKNWSVHLGSFPGSKSITQLQNFCLHGRLEFMPHIQDYQMQTECLQNNLQPNDLSSSRTRNLTTCNRAQTFIQPDVYLQKLRKLPHTTLVQDRLRHHMGTSMLGNCSPYYFTQKPMPKDDT
jgi:hypothetical protein